jgi:HlyD family secretion protein
VIAAKQRLAEAEDDLAGTRVTAVIAGKVLTVAGEVGSEVSGGSTFITLADVVGMQVAASFPEADAAALVAGQQAAVSLANHPGEQFPAVVVRVDPVGTTDGTMVRYGAVLAFEEAPADLLVGQNAGVRVTTASVSEVLRVPATSLRGDGTVLVDTPDGMVPRAVEAGLRGDQYIEIKSGLQEGDRVVVTGS